MFKIVFEVVFMLVFISFIMFFLLTSDVWSYLLLKGRNSFLPPQFTSKAFFGLPLCRIIQKEWCKSKDDSFVYS